ncbi:MAG: hypothetical protein M1300_04510 [Epsilonproteobacteria bacterium]|nr:hypothetical protein [Campylobacterota bacterium]
MSFKKNHIDDSGCEGVVGGYAIRARDNIRVSIVEADKDDEEDYYCPECFSLVRPRKPIDKIDHFYHYARQSDMDYTPESQLHQISKNSLLQALRSIHPNGKWETERKIPSINSIPDISGRINGIRLVIEIQKSSIKPSEITRRTEKYASIGLPVLWIIPLHKPLGDEMFRPRMIEKFFHEMYNGKCFYWDATRPDEIYPVHFSRAYRYIERSEFYSETGDLQSFGGYNKAYKTIKTPNYGRYINITEAFDTEIIEGAKRYLDTETVLPKAFLYKPKQNIWWDRHDNSIAEEIIIDRLNTLQIKRVTFGKYKNKSIKDFISDDSYCEWFEKNVDLIIKHSNIYEAINLKRELSKISGKDTKK